MRIRFAAAAILTVVAIAHDSKANEAEITKLQKTIAAKVDALLKALQEKDVKTLQSLVGDKASIVGANGMTLTKEQLLKFVASPDHQATIDPLFRKTIDGKKRNNREQGEVGAVTHD